MNLSQIQGIGTDIIEISRFQKYSQRFLFRCYAASEQQTCTKPENLAGHFAAKEAVAKALGTGFTGFWPSAIEIKHNKAGKPEVILHNGAAKIASAAGITKIDVSISHCKTFAVAMAVAQKG